MAATTAASRTSLPYTITNYDVTGLALPSALHTMHYFPAEGDYDFKIDPEGSRPRLPSRSPWPSGSMASRWRPLRIRYGRQRRDNLGSLEGADKTMRVHVPAGEHWVAISGAEPLSKALPAKYNGNKPNNGS